MSKKALRSGAICEYLSGLQEYVSTEQSVGLMHWATSVPNKYEKKSCAADNTSKMKAGEKNAGIEWIE